MTTTPQAALVLDAQAVRAVLPKVDTLGAMRALFSELGQGQAVQPAQTLTLFPEDKGDFITYQGASTGANLFGAKLSPYLVQPGKPIITAWTVLMSMETGQPLMLCDSGELTTERTAGTTALAVDHLAKSDAKVLTIIGSGKVAQAHLRHTLALRDWSEIRVYSPSLGGNADLQAQWQALDARVSFAGSAAAAGWSADAIRGDLAQLQVKSCDTPSGEKPVFFRSIGLGLEDIFMARAVYDAAKS